MLGWIITFAYAAVLAGITSLSCSLPFPSCELCRRSFRWADLQDDGILKLYDEANQIECFYAADTSTNTKRMLTIVTLGGAPFPNGAGTCEVASYQAIPNLLSLPYCATPPDGGRSAYKSTTLMKIYYDIPGAVNATATFTRTPSPSPSNDAASMVMSLFAAAGTIAAAGAALVL